MVPFSATAATGRADFFADLDLDFVRGRADFFFMGFIQFAELIAPSLHAALCYQHLLICGLSSICR